MKRNLACILLLAGLTAIGHSAEMRMWLSRKGGLMEAQLLNVQGDSVTLIDKESRETRIKMEELSLSDRMHLVEVGGVDAAVIGTGKTGLIEKEIKVNAAQFNHPKDALTFGDKMPKGFELLETPHFLIGTAGKVQGHATAETAERLWHGMAFEHVSFRQDWGDKRMLILLVEDRETFKALGKWHANAIATLMMQHGHDGQDAAAEALSTWDHVACNGILVPDDMQASHNILRRAMVFNVKETNAKEAAKETARFRKVFDPFVTHCIADDLLHLEMGQVESFGAEGYFAVSTGHAFFKEISLSGKSETNLITVGGSTKDEFASKGGFADGTSWARTLHALVRSGKVTPKLDAMFKWKTEDLTPERLVLMYSFSCYMESDAKRLASYAKMIRRIGTSSQIPSQMEIAKLFGFETVEAFEADWVKYIKEGDFR